MDWRRQRTEDCPPYPPMRHGSVELPYFLDDEKIQKFRKTEFLMLRINPGGEWNLRIDLIPWDRTFEPHQFFD